MLRNLSNLHHAYLLVGSSVEALKALHELFEREGANLVGSPDFFLYNEPLFGIEEARKLSEAAIRKAFGERKIFFISPEKLTLEAQNALLKTFEEPIPETHFFLSVRDENLIIPTLRSRMQVIRLSQGAQDFKEVDKFLKSSLKERLSFVKRFVDEERNISIFLDELLTLLRKSTESLEQVEKVYKVKLVSDDRGTSPRLILEHLALVL